MTTLPTLTWEKNLLSLAQEADVPAALARTRPATDAARLAEAYEYCAELTAIHSRSFSLATRLLPAEKRRAMRTLYAFCRVSDDIVDRPGPDAGQRLEEWKLKIFSVQPDDEDLVALAWADTRQRFAIPPRYAEQLIEGVGRDLVQNRYQTFDDLAAYAYGVASTVGLMSKHIIGYSGPRAIPYAIKLGVALQITNILRDVGEDQRAGRVYLPAQELAEYSLSEADLAVGEVSERWRQFMRFQIQRNRRLYAEAWPGIAMLHKDGRLAVAAAAGFYQEILSDIEAHDYDVFNRRAYLSGHAKLRMIPGLWWRTR
ncbi:MAG TPA: squalene/phytoene synthase family protein [Anaerolineae bacterium]|jgi:phytoene synthase|nr:squalene/phytoene synthase family protein [Anaerolineae bacterium]